MSLWEKVLAFILDLISGRYFDAGREAGRVEVGKQQQEQADALRKDYDEITGDDRDLPTAIDRLHQRAAARKPANTGSRGRMP